MCAGSAANRAFSVARMLVETHLKWSSIAWIACGSPPSVLVQDQLHQRGIVPEIAHRVMQPGGEETALVSRVVHEHPATLGDIERVRKDAAKPVERRQVGRAGGLLLRQKEVGIHRGG